MTIQAVQATLLTATPMGSTPSNAGERPPGPPVLPAVQDLMASGDAGSMIAALCVEMGRTQKKQALENRRSAEALESSEQNAQIEALRDKADLTRVQGFVDAAFTVGEGAMSFGSEMNGAASMEHDGRAKELAADGLHFAEGGENISAGRTKSEGAWCKAGTDATKAGQSIADGLFKGAIADDDTDAQVHEQLATRAKRAVDDAMGEVEDAKKLIEKALDFYKEYTGAKNGAVSAAIHRA